MRAYVDTSAAAKLLQDEIESPAMVRFVNEDDVDLVGTFLLETELRRLANRSRISQATVTELLSSVSLYPLVDADFAAAGLLPGELLRSLDALHVQGAIALRADCVVTYDARLADACQQMGLPVVQPGVTAI